MARTASDYIARALEMFEAGFTTKSAQKDALDNVSRAFDRVKEDVQNALCERYFWVMEYKDVPLEVRLLSDDLCCMYPHQFRDRHADALVALGFDAKPFVELADFRNTIKSAEIIKVAVKEPCAKTIEIQKFIGDELARLKKCYVEGLDLSERLGHLPVTANSHWVVNQYGHGFPRTFYFLNGKLTRLSIIICIAEELERRKEVA